MTSLILVCLFGFETLEYGPVFRKQSRTGGVEVWLWRTTVCDCEPLHDTLLYNYKTIKHQVSLKSLHWGRLLSPLAYLGWGRCGLRGVSSSGVGVGEGVGVLVLRSRGECWFLDDCLPGASWREALLRVVVLWVGGALFIFGPGVSGLVMQFPLDADLGLAVVDEVSLD